MPTGHDAFQTHSTGRLQTTSIVSPVFNLTGAAASDASAKPLYLPGGFELTTLTQAEAARPFTITTVDNSNRIAVNGVKTLDPGKVSMVMVSAL